MALKDRLAPLLGVGDRVAAWELLDSLTGDDLREAKTWFATSKRWFDRLDEEITFSGVDHDDRFVNREEAQWIVASCALVLAGPATAARRVPWGDLWDYRTEVGEGDFVHRLWEKDRDWASGFVDVAAGLCLGADDRRHAGATLSRVLRAVVVHHGLPCPTGDAFLDAWLSGTPGLVGMNWRDKTAPGLDEWLRHDPLMPDVLIHRLSAGLCIEAWLTPHIVTAVRSGVVSRDVVVGTVLAALTRAQRPAAQQVFAGVLDGIDLDADEIPGGLTFVLGVMATSKGAVSKALLPRALALVSTPDELHDLVQLVASRTEKNHKVTLLKALTPGLASRVGEEAVRSALEILAADEDAAFVERVRRVLDRAGGSAPEAAPATTGAQPTGLWDLDPTPSGADHRPPYASSPPTWQQLFGRNRVDLSDREIAWSVQTTLQALKEDPEAWRAGATDALVALVASGSLMPVRVARVFGDWFVNGGLRDTYPVALWLAGECAAQSRAMAGLSDLLRILGQFAPEIPGDRRPEMPPALVALGARDGRTKAQTEARRLGALLTDAADPDAWVAQVRAAAPSTSASAEPEPRGLWRDLVPREPDPADLPTSDLSGSAVDPASLRALVAKAFGVLAPDTYVAEHLVAAVVTGIAAHGYETVRRELDGLSFDHPPGPQIEAIQLWATGNLDVTAYWRLVEGPVRSDQVVLRIRNEPGLSRETQRRLSEALPPLSAQLAPGFDAAGVPGLPDLPRWLVECRDESDQPGARTDQLSPPLLLPYWFGQVRRTTQFLHTLECLLVAGRTPVVLATPEWRDGTLSYDTLVERLRATAISGGSVGHLDLVLALHRMRPVEPRRSAELDALEPVGTSPHLTSSEGVEAYDAVGLLRTWVASGGLPPLDARAVDGLWTGDATSPVPYSSCRAVPEALAAAGFFLGHDEERALLEPRQPDRTCHEAYGSSSETPSSQGLPSALSGEVGEPLHDRYLALLTPLHRGADQRYVRALELPLAHRRFRSDLFVRAALGRHRAGTLRLGQLASSFEVLCEHGSLSALWTSMLEIAGALASESRRPPDLQALLRVLNRYVVEVPAPRPAPEGLRVFTASKGSTKAHLEARALVAALDAAAAQKETA